MIVPKLISVVLDGTALDATLHSSLCKLTELLYMLLWFLSDARGACPHWPIRTYLCGHTPNSQPCCFSNAKCNPSKINIDVRQHEYKVAASIMTMNAHINNCAMINRSVSKHDLPESSKHWAFQIVNFCLCFVNTFFALGHFQSLL